MNLGGYCFANSYHYYFWSHWVFLNNMYWMVNKGILLLSSTNFWVFVKFIKYVICLLKVFSKLCPSHQWSFKCLGMWLMMLCSYAIVVGIFHIFSSCSPKCTNLTFQFLVIKTLVGVKADQLEHMVLQIPSRTKRVATKFEWHEND